MEDTLASPLSRKKANSSEVAKTRWTLDETGLDALLRALHPDKDEGAKRYAALHRRLVRFFEWNHVEQPGALADEALNRLTRRIVTSSGDDDAVRAPETFVAGIARLLLREQWRDQSAGVQRASALLQYNQALEQRQKEQKEVEHLSALMDECLAELAPAQRELIERYYSTESRDQMDGRKKLAAEYDISLNALRNRAMRIRADVERSVRRKLGRNPA